MTGANPLVSVIVPARNAQAYIATAIASACAQTHRNLEVLVVDDGSRDRTGAVVRALAECDRRVRLLTQRHQGVAAARNRAILEARGQYIAPLDADDIWFPHKLERQVQALHAQPGAGLAYAWSVDVDEYGRLTGGYYAHELPSSVRAALIYRNVVGCSSVPLIRRACLEQAGLYDESGYALNGVQGCEDLDLYLRIAERCPFTLVRDFLVGYRQSRGRMSSNALAMGRSFRLALHGCRRRHPGVPARVLRWSLARQWFHLHLLARGNGELALALALLLASASSDPRLLLEGQFHWNLLPRRLRGRVGAAAGATRRTPAAAGALAAIEARRAHAPSPMFERFEALYQRRLRITEALLADPPFSPPPAARVLETHAPALQEPPA